MAASTDEYVPDPNELQQQLEEKDQLVHALTERLEEAAERLDRVQRSGADKGARVSGGGLSPDALAQQQSLFEQLGKTVELWEDVQPRDAFARIESRLDELRDLLQSSAVGRPNAVAPARAPASSPKADPPSREKAPSNSLSKKDDSLSAWEKMKAELMGTDSSNASAATNQPPAIAEKEENDPAASEAPATSEVADVRKSTAPVQQEASSLEPLSALDLPEPIDVDTADHSELAAGIEVRDQYIGYLTRRLRSAENRIHQPIDWEVLNNAPEQLRETLQQLEGDLVDRLRIAEVDLSLERARLSRVETRVRGMQKQIEKRLHSVAGKGPTKNGEPSDGAKNGKGPKSWFGSLGR